MRANLTDGFKYNLFGKVMSIVVSLLTSILIIREIGKEEYGLFLFVNSIFIILTPLYELGLNVPLVRYISEYKVNHQSGKIRTIILKSLNLKIISWIALSSIILVVWNKFYPETFAVAIILTIITLLKSINNTFTFSLEPFYEQKLLNAVGIVADCVHLALIVYVIKVMPDITIIILVGIVPYLLRCLLLWKKIKHVISAVPEKIDDDYKRITKFAVSSMLMGIISYVTYEKSEVLFLGMYRTESEVATYGLAYDLALRIPNFLTMAIGSLHYVFMTELYTRNPTDLLTAVSKFEKLMFVFGIPACVWGLIEAKNIISILYGDIMVDAVFPFQIILVLITINLIIFPINSVIAVLEKQPFATAIGAIFCIINVFLDIALIPKYGINGALFIIGVFFLSAVAFWGACTYRWIGMFLPVRSIGKYLISAIPMALLLILSNEICSNLIFLIIMSIISIACYLAMLVVSRAFSIEEIKALCKNLY